MGRHAALLALVLLAACARQAPADKTAEKAAADAAAIAQVEAAQDGKPPLRPVEPQPIGYFDITRNKLYGSGCNFVADGGGMGAAALAQADRAVIKLAGHPIVLAADKGSTRLPQGAWSRYAGKDYALSLTRREGDKAAKNGVVELFDGRLVITDAFERPVWQANGNIQCKPM